jgi:hypothetical protein
MAQIDTLTNVGAVVSTDLALILRGGANVLGTLGSMVGQNSTAVTITGGTINGTVIGGTTAAAGSFTTGSFSETTFVGLTARPAGVPATAGRLWAAQNETGNYGIASKASTTDSFTYIGNTGTKATLGQSYGSTGSYLPLALQTSDIDRLTISAAGAATFSGSVALAGSSGGLLLNNSATADNTIQLNTTGGTTFVGANGSAGNRFIGSSAYAATFGTTHANALELATANTVRMTLDASGSVGIGVVPIAHHYKSLEIGNAGSQITGRTGADTYFMSGLYWSSSSTIKYAVSSVPVGYYNITNGAHSWNNSAAGTAGNDATINTAMTLDASGNLLVGCTSLPSSSVKGAGFTPTATGTDLYLGSNTATGDNQIVFYNPNGLVGSISTSASATQYNTSSDPRLKSEFAPTTGALAKIVEAHDNQLIGEFHFLSDPDTTVWGYNAHALIDNQPGFGGTEGAGPRDMAIGEEYEPATFDEDGNEITPAKKVTPAGVDQSKRVPLLEAAIYDLLKMNEGLTARLDAAGL